MVKGIRCSISTMVKIQKKTGNNPILIIKEPINITSQLKILNQSSKEKLLRNKIDELD
jgi:hypothetical protein